MARVSYERLPSQGKSVEEINVVGDFTPEEERRIHLAPRGTVFLFYSTLVDSSCF